jgi:hypothetical protein
MREQPAQLSPIGEKMNKLLPSSTLILSVLLLAGCFQNEQNTAASKADGDSIAKVSGADVNLSDPYKKNYQGPVREIKDPYLTLGQLNVLAFDSTRALDSLGFPIHITTALAKSTVSGSWVGVIPWNLSSCPISDRVNIYMDDQDGRLNFSYFSSLSPAPEGLNDNNVTNTRIIMCKVDGSNFRRLRDVNYAVFNFGDGNQSCANGGVNYEQTIDNEDGSNNNSWSGCCGANNPDWWSTGGGLKGYVKLRVCYYPKDPTMAVSLTFPNVINRNYGVFTEAGQDNKYTQSYGEVYSDDESDNNGNNQLLVGGTGTSTWFNKDILDWQKVGASLNGWTLWRFGKIKEYVP